MCTRNHFNQKATKSRLDKVSEIADHTFTLNSYVVLRSIEYKYFDFRTTVKTNI